MAQTLPIPAGQPLDATRKAAGQVVTLAGAEAVAVQAAASNSQHAVNHTVSGVRVRSKIVTPPSSGSPSPTCSASSCCRG